jgi:hypothetical protein
MPEAVLRLAERLASLPPEVLAVLGSLFSEDAAARALEQPKHES